jgi:hypothetical protein
MCMLNGGNEARTSPPEQACLDIRFYGGGYGLKKINLSS